MYIKGCHRLIHHHHHHCSKEHLQDYLNECHFRYYRKSIMKTIFDADKLQKKNQYNQSRLFYRVGFFILFGVIS